MIRALTEGKINLRMTPSFLQGLTTGGIIAVTEGGLTGISDDFEEMAARLATSPKPETPNPGIRNQKTETRNSKLKTRGRNARPETRNSDPETRNPRPEARNPQNPQKRNPKIAQCNLII